MRKSNSGEIVTILLIVLAVAGAVGVATKGQGTKWYAPATWFSHKPADKVDEAKKLDDAAAAAKQSAKDEAIHAAAIESDKAARAAQHLPTSQEAVVVQRFTTNTFGLLNQVSPITSVEQDNNTTILLGLLSAESAKRQAAEALQAKSEADKAQISTKLEEAVKAKELASTTLAKRELELRIAFDKENALANELREASARHWILIGLAVILFAAFVYVRLVASKFGATLHLATQILPQDKAQALINNLDGELGKVGQYLVKTGRDAAKKLQDEAKEIVASHTP